MLSALIVAMHSLYPHQTLGVTYRPFKHDLQDLTSSIPLPRSLVPKRSRVGTSLPIHSKPAPSTSPQAHAPLTHSSHSFTHSFPFSPPLLHYHLSHTSSKQDKHPFIPHRTHAHSSPPFTHTRLIPHLNFLYPSSSLDQPSRAFIHSFIYPGPKKELAPRMKEMET